MLYIQIDFNSDEALYMQLRNQIIYGIATDSIKEGEALPSVRQLADTIGINMHTVNKAYAVLRQEGFVKLDRRKGAVVALDVDKIQAMEDLTAEMNVVLAKAICKNVTRDEIHRIVDQVLDGYLEENGKSS
jgi:GntR family transcriptional regulator